MKSTAASSFSIDPLRLCIAAVLALSAAPATAQRVDFEMRAGFAGSSPLAEDLIATPALQLRLGDAFEGGVKAVPSPGIVVGLAAATPLRDRTRLELAGGWTFSTLRAHDDASSRDIQDLGVLHATLGIRYSPAAPWSVSGAFGAVRYFTDETGIFAAGSSLHPLIELGAGVQLPWADNRIRILATGQMHRFGLSLGGPAGSDGTIIRGLIQAAVRVGGAR